MVRTEDDLHLGEWLSASGILKPPATFQNVIIHLFLGCTRNGLVHIKAMIIDSLHLSDSNSTVLSASHIPKPLPSVQHVRFPSSCSGFTSRGIGLAPCEEASHLFCSRLSIQEQLRRISKQKFCPVRFVIGCTLILNIYIYTV